MTSQFKRLLGLTAAIVLGATAFAGTADAAKLRMAWAQDATGLDPHKQTAFSSLRLLELIYEPLVRLDAELKIVPGIAKSWAFSADGKELTFKLDPKAKFQNGAAVTPADVKASFERILDEKTGAANRANYLSIASIETPDAETVTFKLSQPDAPILTAMTDTNSSIVPAADIAAGTIGTKAVGSGPFKLERWDPNSKEILTANKDWAGGATGVEGIEISVLPDETAILAAMRTGQIDFALLNDPLIATLVPKEPKLQLNRAPVLAYHVLQLNPARKPMNELAVRQAISCAVDRQAVLDTASLGEGKVTGPLTMPFFASDPNTLFCYKRDVEKAKKLMADAGMTGGFTATVIAATGEPPTAAAEAQVLQAQLAEIGVKLDIKMMELNVYVDTWLKGDFDMAIALNGGRPDPYTMYNRYWTKNGNLQKVSNFADDTLDALLQKGRVETDPEKRKAIFADFDKELAEKSPWVWLYTSYGYTAQQKNVQGFVPMPTGSLASLGKVTVGQ
ncbi:MULTISPECIES: ABC transporter substrate-binding protein [Phyllobacteriaceae]|jgi:peptide/nickel transport system substrate-binding protein|uniref:ABC transporter substrate-binding protein n=1 Tax=Mesorhizobium hungaricum TaxID=1566387 RepID=A0A1C2DIX3_9HYPH|nr:MULTISPECIES: ABC transporter substrate-binding protein [Mesorhizobium]MBN9233075.1 ABC transporter substrate-binding protein [Mesorhizobium sp.]MDQ0332240.1 peptide/nickel transport system substrate-binding protein [Mesorhizobium sp. YL-MeA3-2017]OCX14700.1 ABC transporter substrate-binding protein [Mesorhizobium hungaricum]